jgi:hypothetical protein
MATRIHKMLVDLIARKMKMKGYRIVAIEDNLLKLPKNERMPIPLRIKRHRPDIIGINLCTRRLCIGEAKTANDLFSKRTIEQFNDFSGVIGKNSGEKAELIIGVPQRSLETLSDLLRKTNLPVDSVSIIFLPEELVEDEHKEII